MTLKVNGVVENFDQNELTVLELLRFKGVKRPEIIGVEVNGKVVNRNKYETTKLNEGDEVEFVYLMGGGK